jgi:uncharacterized protein
MNDADRPSLRSCRTRSACASLLLAAIGFYKRHVSPHKGFACAYRMHVGACSCSTLGLRAVSRYGAWRGLGVLRLRFGQCRLAADELHRRPRPFVPPGQAGFCDCDVPCDASCVDGCPLGDACSIGDACGAIECCDVADDCNWWGTSNRPEPAEPRPALQRRRRRRGEPSAGERAPPPAPQDSG